MRHWAKPAALLAVGVFVAIWLQINTATRLPDGLPDGLLAGQTVGQLTEPTALWVVVAALVAVVMCAATAFLFQRFVIVGLCLGVLAVSFGVDLPYRHIFTHCEYTVSVTRASYATRRSGQDVRLFADDIVCDGAAPSQPLQSSLQHRARQRAQSQPPPQVLPPQTLQFWDSQQLFAQHRNQRVRVRSNLHPVHSRLNPMAFDYEKYLIANGVRLTAKQLVIVDFPAADSLTADSRSPAPEIRPEMHPETHPERRWVLRTRNAIAAAVMAHLSRDNAATVLALLTGNRTALSAQQKATMRATGTSHLLAISGLHLALVGGVVWVLCQWLWATVPRLSVYWQPIQVGAVAALLAITGYAWLTGFGIPVKRAWLMFSLLLVSWLLKRGVSTNHLLLAATAVMVIDPYAVVSVGFYFSFLATFIVLWSLRLPLAPLPQVLTMQALVNLTLLPITWLTFGVISLSAFFVNLLVIPWLGLWVLPWAIAAVLVQAVAAPLAAPLWTLVDGATTAMWQTIAAAEHLPLTFYPPSRPATLAVVIAVGCWLISLILRQKRWLIGTIMLWLPLSFKATPALIVADSRYTSVLLHNGEHAVLINPGRRYSSYNDADKWRRYLQQKDVALAAIVLQDERLSRISATADLLKTFPNAVVITLTDIDLPYPAKYCQALALPHLTLQTTADSNLGSDCRASIQWFGNTIDLFPEASSQSQSTTHPAQPSTQVFAIAEKSRLIWQGKSYAAQTLGAVTITPQTDRFDVTWQRQPPRLWRFNPASTP